jgi:acetylornithine deacetylase/succinyl-diaminopimelate desuccinylase-like protein
MRCVLGFLLAFAATAATAAADPRTLPTKLEPAWQAKTRAMLKQLIEIPSVKGRNQAPKVAEAVAAELRAAGIPAADIRIIPYEGLPGDQTAALTARWRAPHASRKPLLLIGHMDVVEAKREDWKYDPFQLREEGGYFYGRGTWDMKGPIVAMTMAVAKLRQAGFKPDRDIILFFSGDEETMQNGAAFATTRWRDLVDAEFGLGGDGGHGYYDRSGRSLGFGLGAAEKVYQTYFFTTHNPGGHSGKPRPDNAI